MEVMVMKWFKIIFLMMLGFTVNISAMNSGNANMPNEEKAQLVQYFVNFYSKCSSVSATKPLKSPVEAFYDQPLSPTIRRTITWCKSLDLPSEGESPISRLGYAGKQRIHDVIHFIFGSLLGCGFIFSNASDDNFVTYVTSYIKNSIQEFPEEEHDVVIERLKGLINVWADVAIALSSESMTSGSRGAYVQKKYYQSHLIRSRTPITSLYKLQEETTWNRFIELLGMYKQDYKTMVMIRLKLATLIKLDFNTALKKMKSEK